ncbi:hypothetical protein F3K44_31430 [Bacillus megaterium]|nr:hypothetical protein [Priestia megaterium]
MAEKKPTPNESSEGIKEKAKEKVSLSKKYMPNLLKKDEKQKEKDKVLIKRASMKRSTATTIGRVIMIGSIVIVALGVFSAFRHNLVLSDLEDQVSAQQQDNSPKIIKILKIFRLLNTLLLNLYVITQALNQERIDKRNVKKLYRVF